MVQIEEHFPLASITTLSIGGPARYFVQVSNGEELQEALDFAKQKQISWLVIGGGSNFLVSDEGYPGLVIKLTSQGITFEDGKVMVQAGTKLQELVDFTIEHQLDGLSTMTGIPGTVGGAIYGSAGAYGDNIRDFLDSITFLDTTDGTIKHFSKHEFSSGYRDSIFKKHKEYIILEASFSGFKTGEYALMREEQAEIMRKRLFKYPLHLKCPGSFFKNVIAADLTQKQLALIPEDKIMFGKIPAGYLLEEVGAKGAQKGKIMVAESHANTFINTGGGTAKDFYQLAQELAKKVYQKFHIRLEPEVQFINLDPFPDY